MKIVLVHYHEIALKGRNRPIFVAKLKDNIKLSLKGLGLEKIIHKESRIFLYFGNLDGNWDLIRGKLKTVFGIANFSLVFTTSLDLKKLKIGLKKEISKKSFKSFRITSKRANKEFSLNSEDLNRKIGDFIRKTSKAKVNLKEPEFIVFIEVLSKEILFYFQKIKGPGGLPVGVSGKMVSLLSGGIDSPVASWRMMKRGSQVTFVHFHSYPYLSRASQDKVKELVKVLNKYQYSSRLYLVPFGDIQREVMLNIPAPYRVLIYRRLMIKIAEQIAEKEEAKALITGESLGQVASQTLENLAVIEDASSLPIFRPLIGMDKEEIISQAKEIDTYSISIIPDQDCCQLFIPKHPKTKSRLKEIKKIESKLDIKELIAKGLKKVETKEYLTTNLGLVVEN
ncbi:MAG: tRNA 4-thiouridine(8) synthase ThiI [Parcubacteria group bacterium]|jgi:thiamine biosynthesis protein ThiI|nr:tRNA 4-thiouridine(8) synthase ThiI [Parcubacteria group bacterium]|tara:strand:- start:86336 stop:87523 length:1188 start_codon:yes stop_codon:yes gene_type:complete